MDSVRIQTGLTERIWFRALDASLDPVTGKTDLLISIWRESDGFFYDFNDDTFKNSGWTTRRTPMTEFSAANAPGSYYYDFDTSSITNPTADDNYQCQVEQSPGTDVANLPAEGEIKVGQFVDDIDVAISTRSSHSAADVWTSVTRTLTSFGTLVADIASNLSGTHGSGSWETLDDTTILNAIAALNNLSIADVQTALTNQGYSSARALLLDFLDAAISSRSSHSAADVDTQLSGTHGSGNWEGDSATILAAIAALNNLSIADVQTALTNQGYSSARALLLDNLDAAISTVISAIGSLNDISIADVQTALDNQGYTSLRAAFLDNLDATISGIPAAIDFVLSAVHGSGSWEGDSAATIDALLTANHGAGNWTTAILTGIALEATAQAIKLVTDNLPDGGSLTSIAQELTAQGIKTSTDAMAPQVDELYEGMFGRWKIDTGTNQLLLYAQDNITLLHTFDLKDISGFPAFLNIFERVHI